MPFKYPRRIAWWMGTDALKLVSFPPGKAIWKLRILLERIYWKIFWRGYEHWVVSPHMVKYLAQFGIAKEIKIIPDPPKLFPGFKKMAHEGFNVLYYYPGDLGNPKFKRWVYGYDIYKKVKEYFGGRVNWIVVNGSDDMFGTYSVTDFYFRPNRHDGMPKMILECKMLDIPYYWSFKFKPNVEEAVYAINSHIRDNM